MTVIRYFVTAVFVAALVASMALKGCSPADNGPGGELGKLVGARAARAQLAQFFADWAAAVELGKLADTAQLESAMALGRELLQADGRLPNLKEAGAAIDARLKSSIGEQTVPLDEPNRKRVAEALRSIAAEF